MHNLVSDIGATMHENELSDPMNSRHQDFFQFADAALPNDADRSLTLPNISLKRKYQDLDHPITEHPHDKYSKRLAPCSSPLHQPLSSQSNKYTELVHQTCLESNPIDTVEYVLFDETFMPVTQAPTNQSAAYMQYSLVHTTNGLAVHHSELHRGTAADASADWVNVDLLDLDQRQWFFEETNPSANTSDATSTGSANVSVESEIRLGTSVADIGAGNNSRSTDGDIFCYKQPTPPTVDDGAGSKGSASANKFVPTSNEDYEDKNLSWLFNFKLDELPHLSPEVNRSPSNRNRTGIGLKVDEIIKEATAIDAAIVTAADDDRTRSASDHHHESQQHFQQQSFDDSPSKVSKKPPFTYTELIEYALEDKSELTVSGIYTWISDRFPYYKSNDDRWKNSVRHNLSINPHFRKGSKAAQGAGHLWTISTRDSDANVLAWEHKKQRFDLFFKMEKIHMEKQRQSSVSETESMDEAAIAASNIEFIDATNNSTSPPPNNGSTQEQQTTASYNHLFDELNADDLRRSAGEILNGVRRTVEVQVISPTENLFPAEGLLIDTDYLNPVSKDQIARECGLRSHRGDSTDHATQYGIGGLNAIDGTANEYFVTDIDPITLGVHMNHANHHHHHHHVEDEEVLFGDDFNLNYFGMVNGNNIMT